MQELGSLLTVNESGRYMYCDLLQLPKGESCMSLEPQLRGPSFLHLNYATSGWGGGEGRGDKDEHGQLTTVKMLMKTVCYMSAAILDIPVYKTSSHQNEKIQALHVLFTLYSEFKNSQVTPSLSAHHICLHKLAVCS